MNDGRFYCLSQNSLVTVRLLLSYAIYYSRLPTSTRVLLLFLRRVMCWCVRDSPMFE